MLKPLFLETFAEYFCDCSLLCSVCETLLSDGLQRFAKVLGAGLRGKCGGFSAQGFKGRLKIELAAEIVYNNALTFLSIF
jgi:hypothetical protein